VLALLVRVGSCNMSGLQALMLFDWHSGQEWWGGTARWQTDDLRRETEHAGALS
jgi:hypothetical protein